MENSKENQSLVNPIKNKKCKISKKKKNPLNNKIPNKQHHNNNLVIKPHTIFLIFILNF
jgi:uncharacterized Zn-finger protein